MIDMESIWSAKIAIIMIICNLFSIGIGRYAIKIRGLGPSIPVLGLEGLGLPELLATTSLGHIIGAGTILGLRSIQYL
uniref:Photosystem I reaction center subunit PsaK n=1 Tax=Tolypiocladia glomerulata TaxID=860646 RepID=A0A1Z1MUZ9_9FLOR|nr:photosystem I reaction center subunit X [Tolypiocladia glomerulata]ARW69699.1 photosystem I reaction center subunit X [Tolypiocladia glomerulata]